MRKHIPIYIEDPSKRTARETVRQELAKMLRALERPRKTSAPVNKDEAVLKAYRPHYWTKVGLVKCKLYKMDVLQTGRTVAYYDCIYRDPANGKVHVQTYLYGLKDGKPKQINFFSERYYDTYPAHYHTD